MIYNLLVLGGGNSPERDISLLSARNVAISAKNAGFKVTEEDPEKGLSFLDSLAKDTIVLPILHGEGGEDGSIQKEMEQRDIPFLGSYSRASANSFDKWKTHKILNEAGVPMARADLVKQGDYNKHPLANEPHVVKVALGGSSIGMAISRDGKLISESKIKEIFSACDRVIIEELIKGVEITVPVLDMTALPAIEIKPPANQEFDFENKYNGLTKEICPPVSLTAKQHNDAQRLAEKVHSAMKCRHLSRVDMIMEPSGKFKVLEINTIPGLTKESLYPKSAALLGMDMEKLVSSLVDLVKRDYGLD